ncbi:MAG: BatD family protein [Saprospiraceae bacterium]
MKPYYLIIILLGFAYSLTAQKVEFVATASSQKVIMGDYFQVTYTLKNAEGRNFKAPKFKDFDVQGPSTGFKQYNINGKISSEQNFIYNLIPRKIGKFTLPVASIKLNGKTLKTKPIRIRVVKAEDRKIDSNADLILKAEPSVSDAYVGQSIQLDFTLYASVNISSYKIMQRPDIKGVYIKDVDNFDVPAQTTTINGKPYASKLIYRLILYPQQAGEITIDPLTLRAAIQQGFNHKAVSIYSNPTTIQVKSLPTSPDDFSGAVGTFEMSSRINRNRVTTDETVIFNIEIDGVGDIKRVNPPSLNLAKDSFEVYEPRMNETSQESNGEIYYKKRFEYLISPKQAGEFVFQPTFTYFDIETNDYKTLTIREQPLTILKGTGAGTQKEDRQRSSSELRPIKLKGNLHGTGYFYGSVVFWILLCLPFLALVGLFFYKNKLTKIAGIDPILKKKQKANKIAHERLAEAKNFLSANDSRSFYDNISKTLWGYISDKLNLPASEFTKENVKMQLTNQKVSEEVASQFIEIIKTCEMALFAGMDNTASMQKTYDRTAELIVNLEEMIN